MSLFGTRGAADELARLLDVGTTTAPAPGVVIAARLRSTGMALDAAVVPRPEFRDALRMRLMAVATVQATAPVAAPVAAPVRALEAAVSWRRRGSAVAAGALASVVAVSGVAVAGSQSLPGDPFYGVKKTAEAFQLRTADGDLERGTLHLDLAATRLREVRGLTLGRDAVDAGPELGPSALSGAITLRSATQPLAAGPALSATTADRVTATLAEMDERTREGSDLLTEAYRESRAPEPLRALSRFTTRQTAGLEELLPALPPATQSRARASLALLGDVDATTDELLGIGTCEQYCDPSEAAPPLPGAPVPAPPAGCECPEPAPAPSPVTSPAPAPQPAPTSGGTRPEPTAAPESPEPAPTPSSGVLPVPVPSPTLPVPVPTLPAPLPTITLEPVLEPLEPVLDPLLGSSRSSVSAPEPAPTPVPQLAPSPPRA